LHLFHTGSQKKVIVIKKAVFALSLFTPSIQLMQKSLGILLRCNWLRSTFSASKTPKAYT